MKDLLSYKNMATPVMRFVIFALPLLQLALSEGSSCGEYFGDFPQKQEQLSVVGGEGDFGYNDTQVVTVNLALLLPKNPELGEGCDNCFLVPVLPVIELAIGRAQDLLNAFMAERDNKTIIRFRRIYGDTKCSSTVGPLIAVDMVTSTRPGRRVLSGIVVMILNVHLSSADVFIGLICKYVLAPISRYAGVWGIPVMTPGGLSEAFNLKVKCNTVELSCIGEAQY